jgi:hypothetical protein
MSPEMKRILVPLGFVFIFKPVRAVLAYILLLSFVLTQLFITVKFLGLLGAAFANVSAW